MGKDYSYHVIGFKKNETFLKQNIPKIHPNINIHILDHYEIIDINHYNDIILSLDLWNIFDNEKILLFQSDSFLFNSKDIKHYFKFDYIGALWPHFPNNCYNGNGGFSIRSVKLMKEIINIKKHQKNMNIPEDLYIATIISQNNFSNYCFPSIYECSKFSIENFVVNKNTLIGGHQFWFCLENWEDYVNQAIMTSPRFGNGHGPINHSFKIK